MNSPGVCHFSRTGVVKGICGATDVAHGYNVEIEAGIFFDKAEKDRCPLCERILLRAENDHLKALIKELRGICQRVLSVNVN